MNPQLFLTVFFILTPSYKSQINLTIYHNTDMYSRFEESLDYKTEKMIGGFSRLAQVLETARTKNSPRSYNTVLYLNAGNTFTGTYLYHIHKWKIVASLMDVLKPSAVALGSQEFVDGLENLEQFLEAITFPVVAANIMAPNGTIFSRIVQPSLVLNIENVSVGIIGYTSKDTQTNYPVGNLVFTDALDAVREECEKFQNSNVTIVIALGNADFETDLNIAKKAGCIDVLVGGDSKLFLWNNDPNKLLDDQPHSTYPMVIQNDQGKMVPILEGYSKTKYIGRIDLQFDPKGDLIGYSGNPVLLDDKISKHDKITPLLRTFTFPLSTRFKDTKPNSSEVIGRTKVFLSADKCREEECNLGNMVADALVEYKASKYKGKYWTDTPIAFMNAGAVRTSINVTKADGNITRKDVETTLPFQQQLLSVVLQGRDLKHTLEVGARYNGETRRGEFLLVSGLRVVYDFTKPPFSRVISVLARCGKCKTPTYSPLNYNEYYKILTSVYVANGGDGHTAIRKNSLSFAMEGLTEQAATIKYLQTYFDVRPECDDRIVHMRYLGSHQSPVVYINDCGGLIMIITIGINYIYLFLSINILMC